MTDWTNLPLEELEAIGAPVEEAIPSLRDPGDVVLYKRCLDLGVIPFCAEDIGGVYVRFPVDGHYEIAGLTSRWFGAWMTDKYYLSQGVSPKKVDLEGAIRLLDSMAFRTPKRKTFVRLARLNGKIYLDLADEAFRVVEIDAAGWRIIDNSPAWFMRHPSTKALPLPQEGGSLNLLREFTHLSDEDFVMTIGWLVASMNPEGPFPLLVLSSEHGSGKSTLTTLLQRIIDPNTTERLAAFRDADALFSTATSRWIMPYDNLGKISEENSNHLCRLATGGGYSKRQLYTDNDSYSITVKRPCILNGIALTLGRMDLLDRAYPVRLAPIPEGRLRTEGELYSAFEEVHPCILGALLTAISAAIREEAYTPRNTSRMADGETFILRAEKGGGLPWPVGTFGKVLARREAEKRDDAILDDLVASKIVNLSEGHGWEGSLKHLLQIIREGSDAEERGFVPAHPRGLTKKLEELMPLLRSKGIRLEKRKTEIGQWIVISMRPKNETTERPFDFFEMTG